MSKEQHLTDLLCRALPYLMDLQKDNIEDRSVGIFEDTTLSALVEEVEYFFMPEGEKKKVDQRLQDEAAEEERMELEANVAEAIQVIESLYPPDSGYEDTAQIGRDLMLLKVGNSVVWERWRDLPAADLFALANANLQREGLSPKF
jgi:hypothetical protein